MVHPTVSFMLLKNGIARLFPPENALLTEERLKSRTLLRVCSPLDIVVPYVMTLQVQGDRKCTDVLLLLMLMAAWAAMTFLGLIVMGIIPNDYLEPGNPQRLLNGIDYDGRICGVDSGVEVLEQTLSVVVYGTLHRTRS